MLTLRTNLAKLGDLRHLYYSDGPNSGNCENICPSGGYGFFCYNRSAVNRCGCISKSNFQVCPILGSTKDPRWSAFPIQEKAIGMGNFEVLSPNRFGVSPNDNDCCDSTDEVIACATGKERTLAEEYEVNARCIYGPDAMPSNEQVPLMPVASTMMLNYCFSEETDPLKIPTSLKTCPKAVSRRTACDPVAAEIPAEYDQRAIEYCRALYNRVKDTSDAQTTIRMSGCQCVMDSSILPDIALTAMTSIPGLNQAPHCVWVPCLPTSDNIKLQVSDANRPCTAAGCLALTLATGNALLTNAVFNQNVNCSGDREVVKPPVVNPPGDNPTGDNPTGVNPTEDNPTGVNPTGVNTTKKTTMIVAISCGLAFLVFVFVVVYYVKSRRRQKLEQLETQQ